MNIEIKTIDVAGNEFDYQQFNTSDEILKLINDDGIPIGSSTIEIINYDTHQKNIITILKDNKKLNIQSETVSLFETIEKPIFKNPLKD